MQSSTCHKAIVEDTYKIRNIPAVRLAVLMLGQIDRQLLEPSLVLRVAALCMVVLLQAVL